MTPHDKREIKVKPGIDPAEFEWDAIGKEFMKGRILRLSRVRRLSRM